MRLNRSLKDLWWDMRPSPGFGTLEIRVCDGLATLSEAVAITALFTCLLIGLNEHGVWIDQFPSPPHWLSRENKWRVMRHGLSADMVTNLDGTTKPVAAEIEEWLVRTSSYADKLGYGKHVEMIREILVKGNSTTRQELCLLQLVHCKLL